LTAPGFAATLYLRVSTPKTKEPFTMSMFRALFIAFFKHFARAKSIKGGSGHYNEQCHPSTYG
jgi:hypothetical protein